MPKDTVAKDKKEPTLRFDMNVLRAADGQISTGTAASDKAVAAEKERIAKAAERRAYLSETPSGRKILNQEAKRERDKKAKETRRDVSDQFGLGRDAQKEAKGAKADAQREKNFNQLMERVKVTPRNVAARDASRAMLRNLTEGPVVGKDNKTGKDVRDPSQINKYFTPAQVTALKAEFERLKGKNYSGSKKNKGNFQNRTLESAITGRPQKGREYVKQREGVQATDLRRSRAPQAQAIRDKVVRGRGRPKGSKNKPKS